VRLQTDTPALAGLPWADTAWEGNVLRDHGWTFELIGGSVGATLLEFDDITLRTPCPVLLIAPSAAPDADLHHRALEERLKPAWPFYHEPFMRVRDWAGFEQAWQRRRARIIYYYGPADSDGTTLTLLLDDAPGRIDRRPVTALAQVWGATPPQLMFCNIVGTPVAPNTALADLHLPLVISQYGVEARQARQAALEWLHALLEGDEATDPVWALHQHGLSTAVAWGAYGHLAPSCSTATRGSKVMSAPMSRSISTSATVALLYRFAMSPEPLGLAGRSATRHNLASDDTSMTCLVKSAACFGCTRRGL